tara:strand:+ start:53 stop:1192 length:1140 start_codon:yes stop_codon:yes gene_type:complete
MGGLKTIARSAGHRYFVTGIAPLALSGDSIFNSANHLSFRGPFADMLGFTEVEVSSVLVKVARIEDNEELGKAMEAARQLYNGHLFFGSGTRLYNPQLVLQFAENYQSEGLKRSVDGFLKYSVVDGKLLDNNNQMVSEAQCRLIDASPDYIRAVCSIEHGVSKHVNVVLSAKQLANDPISYFWYGGQLTLREPCKSPDDELTPPFLRVANRATQKNFVDVYLTVHAKRERNDFVDEPSVNGLRALCEQMLTDHPVMDEENSEGDLEARMSIAFYMYNRHTPAHQSRASAVKPLVVGRPKSTDIVVKTDKYHVIIELKYCKGTSASEGEKDKARNQARKYGEQYLQEPREGVDLKVFLVMHCPAATKKGDVLIVEEILVE